MITLQQFVQREIIYCVSALVSAVALDEFPELFSRQDYEEPVRDFFEDCDIAIKVDLLDALKVDDIPCLQVTIGVSDDGKTWGYQTGDNSYTGGAYGFPHWGVTYVYPGTTADDILSEWIAETDDYVDIDKDTLEEIRDFLQEVTPTWANFAADLIDDEVTEILKNREPESYQEIAEYFNIEPHDVEALEFWIVENRLADDLEKEGEIIERDFFGLTIWGRTTSGQAFTCDEVIKKIYQDLIAK
ncbi:MAG: hypothetical protein GY696_25075 [Gammaproteobacteria bacterium]|nr:hypothetical protein [Gammaproteobacteria bacterium]